MHVRNLRNGCYAYVNETDFFSERPKLMFSKMMEKKIFTILSSTIVLTSIGDQCIIADRRGRCHYLQKGKVPLSHVRDEIKG